MTFKKEVEKAAAAVAAENWSKNVVKRWCALFITIMSEKIQLRQERRNAQRRRRRHANLKTSHFNVKSHLLNAKKHRLH